jgi:hypothetical protein
MVTVPSTVVPAQIQERVRDLGRAWSLPMLQFLEEALSESPGRDQRGTNKFERTTVAPWSSANRCCSLMGTLVRRKGHG